MKSPLTKTTTLAFSILLGFAASLPAAADKGADTPTYLLANLYVEDFGSYGNDYANHLGPLLDEAGAEILVLTPNMTKLEGNNGANLTIVVRFPSLDAAETYFASEAHAALRPGRIAATDTNVLTPVLATEFIGQAK